MIHGLRDEEQPSLRIFPLLIITLALIGLIGVRLFVLQVLSFDYYRALAENQHQYNQEIIPTRGKIFIRDGLSTTPYLVATNVNRPLVYAVPQQIEDAPVTARTLSQMLGIDQRETYERITDTDRKYVVIAKEIDEQVAEKLQEEALSGIYLEDQRHRIYPQGTLASQVIGFVGFDQDKKVGRYGVEGYFEKDLAGKPGMIEGARGLTGNWITSGPREFVPAKDGVDIVLSIDRAIQFKAEDTIKKAVEAHQAKRGSVIIMDPKTGALLAMANYPSFDPNNYGDVEDISVFKNTSISAAYEPGSVMKPVTMAGALNEGAITPDLEFEDPGFVQLENFTIRNANSKSYGRVNMTTVLNESINTGLIFVEQTLGHQKFTKYMEQFGFGEQTGVELSSEAAGDISNLYRGGDLYPATISYGQGMTATPLQIVTAYAAIANGGSLNRPFIVAEKRYEDGRIDTTQPTEVRRVITRHTATTLAAMMVSVVEQGHGKRAAVPGYYIAGKTGTAQVPYSDRAGYDPNRTIGSFAGFGPVDDPAFVMIVKIEEPRDVIFAESSAAPVFGEIAQFILNYYQIPPTRQ